ncbi:MAG: cell surface protein [Comamonas sp.]
MKKNVLALSIAAMIGGLGFAGAASAGSAYFNTTAAAALGAQADTLALAPSGIGHILVVPYFSTQDGNVSLLNIVNTDTVNGKAVKLRYRGAANSDDVYDITLLLSPGDVWSANVSQEGGVSTLTTNDNSCTLPANVNAAFSAGRVKGGDNAQTLEGYIEILNMADIPAKLATDETGAASGIDNPLFKAIKHVNGVAPCATIASQLADVVDPTGGTAITDAASAAASLALNEWNGRGFNFPSGGLMANWTIVNLSKAGSFTGAATAVAAVAAATPTAKAVGNLVFSPQDSSFQPADAAAVTAGTHPVFLTADPLLVGGTFADGSVAQATIQASLYDFPDLSTPYVTDPTVAGNALKQAEALSASLATLSVSNEYMTSPVVGFATDWTFSMPARRYNVAMDYNGATGKTVLYASTLNYAAAIPPTAKIGVPVDGTYFTKANTQLSTDKTQICVLPGDLNYYDTSEQGAAGGSYVISPQPIGSKLAFCGETSVLTFNNATGSVLGAKIATQNIVTKQSATNTFTDGWMRVQTPGNAQVAVPPATATTRGLPVLGHAFAKALGSSFNLGGIWAHRTDRTGL